MISFISNRYINYFSMPFLHSDLVDPRVKSFLTNKSSNSRGLEETSLKIINRPRNCAFSCLCSFFFFYKGEQGVSKVLEMLRDELKVAMALAGIMFELVTRKSRLNPSSWVYPLIQVQSQVLLTQVLQKLSKKVTCFCFRYK